jgi:hypothetical protein
MNEYDQTCPEFVAFRREVQTIDRNQRIAVVLLHPMQIYHRFAC